MATETRPFAVVTGASSGIGLELAKQCREHGFDLLIVAEDAGIEDAAHALTTNDAVVEAHQLDLAMYDGVEALNRAIHATGRPVEVLILNAGVGVGGEFARDTALQAELKMIALNVSSVVHLAKRVIPGMVERGRGRVLITACITSTSPAPFLAVYGATKAFDLSFAEALRDELKGTGVTVTALQPGPTDTNFFVRAGMLDTKVAQDKKDDPAEVARVGFEAMMAGKDSVIASSLKSKMKGLANEILPETVKAAAQRRETKPGSGVKH
ncbi:MAG: SDR family NAD(P)-dependent oxidoreductase [Deltaproteobacteria bacterium]|nr:SDR family NAD(P)-dependent oxidoreductase [Deltaproteobacteria bacterium]